MKNTRFLLAFLSGAALVGAAVVPAQIGTTSDATMDASAEVQPETSSTDTSGFGSGNTGQDEPAPTPIELQPRASNTVGELQQMINLPTTATLKESEEDLKNPKSVFEGKDLEKIFSNKPRFIYYPEGVDPMIIPWVRERIVAEERFAEAMVAKANKDWEKARAILKDILDKYSTTDEANKVPQALVGIDQAEALAKGAIVDPETPPGESPDQQLPPWIAKNTSGVLIRDEPVVIIGNDFLKVGDTVPRYSSVRVKEISPSEVIFVYQEKDFPVEVIGSF